MLQIGDKMPAFRVLDEAGKEVTEKVKFKEKNALPFPLLSDPTTEMLQAFGAWGEKKNYGKVTMGTLRKTYIFDEIGTLLRIIEKVDTKNHSAQVLE